MTAFHFPPQAGSSGILRTLNFVRHLPANGWDPIVLTAHPRAYEETREDLLKMIPDGVAVFRAQALDAEYHLSLRGRYLSLTALPDRWSSWWFDAVRLGKAIIRKSHPDVLWSTSPISTAHLIGASLARRSGLPWIADFRDPMVTDAYPTDRWQRKIRRLLEARVLEEAQLCVFTTERAAELYRARYPQAASRCQVIENGYDEETFSGLAPTRTGLEPDTLLMLHSGIMYPQGRDPAPFLRAIARLIERGILDKHKLCVRFRAPTHEAEISALAEQHGLQDVIDIAAPIPYRDAVAEMMGADLLLVFQGAAFNAQIPAKIYEYVRASRPILGLVDSQGDTARELRKFNESYLGDIENSDEIERTVKAWLAARPGEGHAERFSENLETVRGFSRQHQAARLAVLLEACLATAAA